VQNIVNTVKIPLKIWSKP